MESTMTDQDAPRRLEVPEATETAPTQVSYFGTDRTEQVYLADGISYVTIKELAEGDRRAIVNSSNSSVRMERATGDAHMKMRTGDERTLLLQRAITGWNLVEQNRQGDIVPVQFSRSALDRFLESAPPTVLEPIEKRVRKMNPWLLPTDATLEQIDEQIEELQELRQRKLDEEEGNES